MVTDIPVRGLKTPVAPETGLRGFLSRSLGKTEDLVGISFFHMGIAGSMTGFAAFLDSTQFPVKYPAVDVHPGQRLIFMTFEACLITDALGTTRIRFRSQTKTEQTEQKADDNEIENQLSPHNFSFILVHILEDYNIIIV
jgi:hypothetical protein